MEKCVKDNEAEPEPYIYFAEAAIGEGRVTDAAALVGIAGVKLSEYKENATRKNNLIKRYYNINAAVAEARERWSEAEKQLQLWVKLDEKSAVAHQRLARVLFQQKSDNPKVMEELKLAAGLEKTLPSPYVSIAQFYEQAKDQANAAKALEQAVAEKPDATNKERVLKSYSGRHAVLRGQQQADRRGEVRGSGDEAGSGFTRRQVDPRHRGPHGQRL
ncbi:MAG: hypothetical protein QM811_30550 [Pirellulales bacterium]